LSVLWLQECSILSISQIAVQLSAWIEEAFFKCIVWFYFEIWHDLDSLLLTALCVLVGRIGVIVDKDGVSRYSCGNICNR